MARLFTNVSIVFAIGLGLGAAAKAKAQPEGPVPTQALVAVEEKSTPPAEASAVTVAVNGHKEPLTAWTPVLAGNAQVALLIDDGLRESMGRELNNLRDFVAHLPPGVEVLVGYMQNGRVVADQPFTTDHALAASILHLPEGVPGVSASPYFCISDFVRKWPDSADSSSSGSGMQPMAHKARFIMMLTNGVDPYNGGTSVMNQGSPYVDAATRDAQRAGVAVYSIYFGDAGMIGRSVNFSGQGYLAQITEGTGGVNYYEGTGNPPSTEPYLKQFVGAISETYVATFPAPGAGKDMVRVKFSADKTKLRAAQEVLPGNVE
ncbi:MAG: hypothetical protein ABR910_16280 [Acidobacteriaceae bacterium]|jgi:hypothetical protein